MPPTSTETLVKEARITHEQAKESLRRLINSHFHPRGSDVERARVSIPARPDYDDDLILSAYVKQQAALEAAPPSAPQAGKWWPHLRRIYDALPKRPHCRDCADENGTCPNSGLPCDPTEEVIARLKAQASPSAPQGGESAAGLADRLNAKGYAKVPNGASQSTLAVVAGVEPSPDVLALALCKSGKFETGQGTCALACMDQLGDPRKSGCAHASRIHRKLAEQLLDALRMAAPSPTPPDVVGWRLIDEGDKSASELLVEWSGDLHIAFYSHRSSKWRDKTTGAYLYPNPTRCFDVPEDRALTGQATPKGDGR